MRVSDKKNNKSPVIIAPTTLVAANWIARRTTEKRAVPRIAKRFSASAEQAQEESVRRAVAADKSVTARYATAMPSATHKNAGVTLITAVIVRNAVIIPIIKLEITAKTPHSILLLQLKADTDFTSTLIYAEILKQVNGFEIPVIYF